MKAGGGDRGFTLVELMIVVAIIGILAAIAIPNFMNFRMKARSAEAKSNLAAIRNLEIAYYAEKSTYVSGQSWSPLHGVVKSSKQPWDPNTRFSVLGYAPEGEVFFEYQLEPTASDYNLSFTARARCDLDEDGLWSIYYLARPVTDLLHTGAQY
jgi:type IV pilus assembly protein PilA